MSRASNTLKASDITTTPIKLKYAFTASSDNFLDYGIVVGSGSNGPVSISGSVPQNTINYRAIRQLYYQNWITGSLKFSSSYWDSNQQSTACSISNEYENRYINTANNARISYVSIPPNVFGEQIARNSLSLSFTSSANNIYAVSLQDDGNGNIIGTSSYYDPFNSDYDTVYFNNGGNIIYSQGVIIITNPTLYNILRPRISLYMTCSFLAETTIYQNQYRCHIAENDFNYTQNLSANKSGTTGSYIDAVTGSDFKPYATCVGLYNESNELLVVGKLSTPYPIPTNTDITFVVRYDS
jgi:hypothetical protein